MSLENYCTFLLTKENTNSELSQNPTEKQIMPFKTTVNWLFNGIWSYLVIGSFNWKSHVFQQTMNVKLLVKHSFVNFDKMKYYDHTLVNLNKM